MFFIIYGGLQEKNFSMMLIKIWSLLEHHLWSIKEFNGCGKDESFIFYKNKNKNKNKNK